MTFLLAALAVLLFLGSVALSRARIRRAARNINAMVEKSFADGHRLIPAEPAQFPWLSSTFYDETQRDLESEGFRFLANVEDATLSETHPDKRTYVRLFTLPDGSVRAAAWEVVLGGPQGRPGTTIRTVELLTELTDGGCVSTTTVPQQRLLDPGPWTFREHQSEKGGVSREEMRRFARPGQQRLADKVHAEMQRQKR